MKINRLEIDISNARVNHAGDMSSVVLRGIREDQKKEVIICCDPAGIRTDHCLPSDYTVKDHKEVDVSEQFAMAACEAVGFDLEGRTLEEMESTAKIRSFWAVGRKNV